jgi:hypothetical protein
MSNYSSTTQAVAPPPAPPNDYLFKLLIIGDASVGKVSYGKSARHDRPKQGISLARRPCSVFHAAAILRQYL